MKETQIKTAERRFAVRYGAVAVVLAAFWWLCYGAAESLSSWFVFEALALDPNSPTGAALQFFVYDTAKILLLLVLLVYVIGFARASLNVERVRGYLAGKGRWTGYGLGALFGAVTPFCSCSSVPLFIGFTMGGIPLGITMAFLITSPVINEVAVVLLCGLLGWKLTVLYVVVGLTAGVLGGFIMDKIQARRWLQPFLLEALQQKTELDTSADARGSLTLRDRHVFASSETKAIVGRVWKWVIVGVGVGALLHGFVPQSWITEHLSGDNLWSVPAAVALGMPLYTNVTGIVPVMESLLMKGLPLGTTLAFCMSTVAASLPEMIMLKQVMRPRLIGAFLATLLVIFTLTGWLLNAVA